MHCVPAFVSVAVQTQKQLRQALRRMNKSIATQDVATGEIAPGAAPTMEALKAALSGLAPRSAVAVAAGAGEAVPEVIKTMQGPPREKKLRYSFNTNLRASRLAADLEDLTDDDEDVRLGRVYHEEGEESEMEGEEVEPAHPVVELAGVKMAPGRNKPKRIK